MNQPEPYYLLKKFLQELPRGNVLDIGSGDGRNGIFLAENGFEVVAIDSDDNAVGKLRDIGEKNKLNIAAQTIDMRLFDFKDKYSVILALNCLQFIKYSERQTIIEKIKESVKDAGIIFISAFTIKDDSFKRFSRQKDPVEKNTFYSESEKRHWSFFDLGELKTCFQDGFEILYYDEKEIKDSGPNPHQHGIVEIVVRKKERN